MLRFVDGSGYCAFSKAFYKYIGGFFHGLSGFSPVGTITGSIDPGPFASTSAIHFQQTNPLYAAVAALDNQQTWIVGLWIQPIAIAAPQTFLVFQDRTGINLGTQLVVQILPSGQIKVCTGFGTNVFVFPTSFDGPDTTFVNGINRDSTNTAAMGQWTHICIKATFSANNGTPPGAVSLYVNGVLDFSVTGVSTNATSQNYANWIVPLWNNASSGSEILISQLVVCDSTGTANNVPVAPSAQIQTIFPNSDVANGSWAASGAGANYQQVDDNPGPGANNVQLASLTFPDELFGIPPLSTSQNNLGVAVNLASLGAAQTFQALTQVSAVSYPIGATLTAPASSIQTLQGIAETNPATGLPWTDAAISAAAWGMRGLTFTGEQVYQMFLEKLWSNPNIGSYSFGK